MTLLQKAKFLLIFPILLLNFSLAFASVSVSIQSLSPSDSISTGTNLTFNVVAAGFNNPSYTLTDSFSGGSVSGGNINGSGNFNWTPNQNDIGTHVLTIAVNDSSGNSATTTEQIIVNSAPTVSIQSLSPSSSVNVGTNVTFNVSTSGFNTPYYTVADNFNGTNLSGSTLTSGDINSSGYFSWTPQSQDVGNHTITVTVSDNSGHVVSTQENIYVSATGNLSIQSISPSTTIAPGQTLTFNAVPNGFSSDNSYSLSDSYGGGSLTNSDINSGGYLSWTPTSNDLGVHTITVTAFDTSGHSYSASETITVQSIPDTTNVVAPTTSSIACPVGYDCVPTIAPTTVTTEPVSTNSYYTFNNYLTPGSTGDDVTALQNILTKEGFFSGPVTGYYGDLTENAVEDFQTAHSLDSLGVVGPATRAALNQIEMNGAATAQSSAASASYQFSNSLSVGSTGTDVTELQNRLTADGVYSGPITGYFGSLTEAGVEAYQTKHDLTAVGIVGPLTRADLNQGI